MEISLAKETINMSAARKSFVGKDEGSKEGEESEDVNPLDVIDQMRSLDPADQYTVDQFLSLLQAQAHERQTRVLLGFLSNLWGPDQLVLRAGKLEVLSLLRSENLGHRLLALQRLIYEDSTIEIPEESDFSSVLDDLQDQVADLVAMRVVEENLDRKIAEKIKARHHEYECAARATMPATKADLIELTKAIDKNTETLRMIVSGLGLSGEGSEVIASVLELHLAHAKKMANTASDLNAIAGKMIDQLESPQEEASDE